MSRKGRSLYLPPVVRQDPADEGETVFPDLFWPESAVVPLLHQQVEFCRAQGGSSYGVVLL